MTNKIVAGLNMYNHEDYGLVKTYNNTEEFVRGLSKHLKMVQICGKNNLTDCFPYEKINYTRANKETYSVDVSRLTSAQKLKLKGNWLDLAGFILANGTPFIISFNNDCAGSKDDFGRDIVDTGKPLTSIPTNCIDGIYDKNGAKPFNTFGKDIQSLFAARVGRICLTELPDGTCVASTPAVAPSPMTKSECEASKSKYGIKECYDGNDYWAGAVKMCADQGMRLPTDDELTKLAQYLYNDHTITSANRRDLHQDYKKVPTSMYGLGSYWYALWSDSEINASRAHSRRFYYSISGMDNDGRYFSDWRAVCIEDD